MSTNPGSKALTRLVADLTATQGDNLVSIILYGSSAIEDRHAGQPDYNVLIVLKEAGIEPLGRLREAMRQWLSARQLPPVVFTTDELDRAADVFPIEFLQMQKARRILHGRDPLESLHISLANLRHQTEYELRTRFLQLRRLYLSQSAAHTNLSQLMLDSFGSFAALFRAVLVLRGEDAPVPNADAVRAIVALLDLGPAPFEWILRRKAGEAPAPTADEVKTVFAAYLAEIERVISAVDNSDVSRM